ncbi:MAG TPA: trigger factor [Streptosporangiaceae bacterium]
MKTEVEELGPTRVKLTIDVPFEELKPSLDKAYREVAKQVRVPGFRVGKVPPRIIDQRFGREVVLEQAVNEAIPELYGKALEEGDVRALGQPDLEVTKLDDGKELSFTAEVDVRPRFEVPDLEGMPVTVDNSEVTPDEVEEYLAGLRERFASLKGVSRPAQSGDFVSIDLAATVDGESVEDAQASGLSYEIGSGTLLDGLDDALEGVTAGESKEFTAGLPGGEHEGEQAEVTVTVHSVKVKDMPDLDDEFAQSASEFDTVGELRAGTRTQLESMKKLQQENQARERSLEALLDKIDIPLPQKIVDEETERRRNSIVEQLQQMGSNLDDYLESMGRSLEEFDTDMERDAQRSVKTGFVLDQLALQEELSVDSQELGNYIAEQAYRMRVEPDRLARQLAEGGQLGTVAADVMRSKAMDIIARRAKVTDEAGNAITLAPPAAPVDAAATDEGDSDEADSEDGAE